MYHPINPWKHIKANIKYKLINLLKLILKVKNINGIRKANPINLPKNLCIHSHQKIILNSLIVIEKFCNLNSGISL